MGATTSTEATTKTTTTSSSASDRFAPKEPVELDAPKNDPISVSELLQCDGVQSEKIYIGIKGDVFDVTGNAKSYGPGKGYHPLVGRDASRALGKMSLTKEDTDPRVSWDYSTLDAKQLKTMDDWYTFFSKRYNIVGKVSDLPSSPSRAQ